MAGDNWYNTRGGREFADITVPRLVETIEQLSATVERLNEKVEHLTEQLHEREPSYKTEYPFSDDAFAQDIVSAYAEMTGHYNLDFEERKNIEKRYLNGSSNQGANEFRLDFDDNTYAHLSYDAENARLLVNEEPYTPGAIARAEISEYMTHGDNGDALKEALEQMQKYGSMNKEQCKRYLLDAVMEHLENVSVPGAEDFANRGTYHGGIAMHIMDAAADYIHQETGREVLWEDDSIFVKEYQREKPVPER